MPPLSVFVSHASIDLPAARQVCGWLTAAGHEVFVDHDSQAGIAVGDDWEEVLHTRLRRADAVLCLVSRAYVESAWCAAEVAIARSRGSRLLPVRAEAGVEHPLLPAIQYADLTADPEDARAHLLSTLRRLVVSGRRVWSDDRSPFPGLRAFEPDEHLAFFGRDGDVERLATTLRSPVERAKHEVLVVVGPSGCGKSSTVRAGLAPTMTAEDDWRVLPALVPGTDPVDGLAAALTIAAGQTGPEWTLAGVRTALEGGGLARLAKELLLADPAHPRQHLLLIVDQLEQLVTLTPPAERARFARLLADGLAGPVRVVATLRPEFLAPLLADPDLAALHTTIAPLAPLGRDALRLVVEGPAQLWGLTVPGELVSRLVDDTGGGAALPLLAFTLARLTEHVERGATLALAAYEALGRVEGALQAQADAALSEAMRSGGIDRDAVLAALLTLVTVDAQGRPTARHRPVDDLPDGVVAAFVGRRLLVTATAADDRATVGVAHETFLTAWPPLRDAIAAAVTALRARGTVEAAARDWAEADRSPDRLWQRGQLSAATAAVGARIVPADGSRRPAWLPGRPRTLVADRVDLDRRAREFLHAGIRRDRFLRSRLVAVLTALLVVVGTLAGVAIDRNARLDRQLTVAAAQLLASAATARAVDDPAFATKLALAAWHADPGGPAARDALVNQYVAMQSVQRVQQGLAVPPVVDFGFLDPEKRLALLVHDDGATIVSDVLAPAPAIWPVPRAPAAAALFTFSAGGQWLAALGDDGAPVVWDLQARAGPYPVDLAGSTSVSPPVLRFSRDSRLLLGVVAAADGGSAIAAWDVATRARVPLPSALVEQQRIVDLWSTSDPELVVVQTTGRIDDADRIVTRSLRDGSVRHVLSERRFGDPAAEVVRGGRAIATCLSDPDADRYSVVLTATDTAAEIARLPLAGGCSSLHVTRDGDHLAEVVGSLDSSYQVTRVLDLDTGTAVEVVVPPGRSENFTAADPTMTVLTPPTGPPTVLVRRGTSVLQLRPTPSPLDTATDRGRAYATADASGVVVDLPDGVVVRDAVSGEERGRLGSLRGRDVDVTLIDVGDGLQVATRTAGRWTIAIYDWLALDVRETYPVPAPADVGPEASMTAVNDNDRLVVLLDGLMSVWDRHSRQQIGESTPIGEDPAEQRAFRKAVVGFRFGRPDQLVIAAPDQPVLLYSLAERRILARLPVPSVTTETVLDSTGSRLAVRTSERTVEVWDIDQGRRAAEPLFAPDASTLLGFSSDGYLVTAGETDTVQWWDLGRGALSGTVRLGGRLADPRDPADPLFLAGSDGGMPGRLPLTAQVWADQLCSMVGPYTEPEVRALPDGAQDRRPCP